MTIVARKALADLQHKGVAERRGLPARSSHRLSCLIHYELPEQMAHYTIHKFKYFEDVKFVELLLRDYL